MEKTNKKTDLRKSILSINQKILFSFLLVFIFGLGFGAKASAATYYAAKVSGTWKYLQDAWPDATHGSNCITNNIQGCHTSANTGNTTVIDGGSSGMTYLPTDLGPLNKISFQKASSTIRGPISSDPDIANHGGVVTLSGQAGVSADVVALVGTTPNGSTLSDVTITSGQSGYGCVSLAGTGVGQELTGINVQRVLIDNCDKAIVVGNYVGTSGTPAIFTDVKSKNCTSAASCISLSSTNLYVTFNYGSVEGSQAFGAAAGAVFLANKVMPGITFNNYNFIGNKGSAIYHDVGTNALTLNISNSIFSGNGYGSITTKTIRNAATSGAVINVSNSNVLPNPLDPKNTTWDTVTESNNSYYEPLFSSHRRSNAVASIIIDDLNSLSDFANDLAPLLEIRGMRGTIAIDTRLATNANYTTLANLINSGHDVALHTDSHARMTDLNGPVIQYVGAGSASTITVSADGTQLTTSVTGGPGGENLNIDLTNASYDRVNHLCSYIDGLASYTCVVNPNNQFTKSTSLRQVTGQDIKTATYIMLLDGVAATGRYYVNEIATAKATLEAGIQNAASNGTPAKTWVCRSLVFPENLTNATTKTAVINAGLLGSRSDDNGQTDIYNIDVTNVRGFQESARFKTLDDTSEVVVKRNISGWLEWLGYSGGLGTIYGHTMHSGDSEYDTSIATWTTVLDTIQANGITVKTFGQALSDIRSAANHNTGNVYFSCAGENESCLSDSGNYNLQSTSSLIDAGSSISGVTTDYANNSVYGLPDVGMYEHQPTLTVGNDTVYKDANITIYGNGKFRNRGTATGGSADLNIDIPGTAALDYLNVAISTWQKTGIRQKTWTEDSSTSGLTNTEHTIGDLENNKYYNITVDTHATNLTGAGCVVLNDKLSCKSNGSGKILFTYGGTYSTHTFDVTEGDNTAPTVSNVSSTTANGTYKAGDTINMRVTFSEAVNITGTPRIKLETGNGNKYATYSAGTGSDTIDFTYTVQAGDNSNDLDYVNATSLELNTGTIKDLVGNDATLTLFAPGSNHSLSYNQAIVLDNTPPTLSNGAPSGTLNTDTTQTSISVTTSEDATCKYATASDTAYGAMTNPMTAITSTTHQATVSNLDEGETYTYYVRCSDTLGNANASDYQIQFSIAPGSRPLTLENVKIKINNKVQKFKNKIYSWENKIKLKQQDSNLTNGTIKVYKGDSLQDSISADINGAWEKTMKLKDDFSGWIEVRQYDQYGTLINSTRNKVVVDTDKPEFKEAIKPQMTISKNQRIEFSAKDNDEVDHYQVKLADVRGWRNQNDDFYQIPDTIPSGTYDLFIRAYDRSGNYAEEKTTLSLALYKHPVSLASVSLSPQNNSESNNQNTQVQPQTKNQTDKNTDRNTDTTPSSSNTNNSSSPQPPTQPKTFHWYNPFSWF